MKTQKPSSAEDAPVTTVPDPPMAVTPARSGTKGALVTFSPPENDGGNPIILYTVTADPTTGQDVQAKHATGQNSPIAVNGLEMGETYSFTVRAKNTDGDSDPSEAATLKIGGAPSKPLAVSATREDGKSSITFNAPTSDGGSEITKYTVYAQDNVVPSNGGQAVDGTSSPIEVTGLANGEAYTFTVTATNEFGTSEESSSSAVVVPGAASPNAPQAPWPNALSFPVHKRIGTLQLQDELRAAVHQDCLVAVINDSPFGTEGTLFVIPNTIDPATVQTTIDNHVFNPDYETPSYMAEFNTVVRKVNDDPGVVLNANEIQVAIKGILARFPVNLSG